ncbi:MAG TPA: succinate dehydrogenase/fumarate reductase iron-sulfur subunit [Solirubrobacteraceae bacterium]|nr:succinate dehydrogenase/fumarate reductase iron-sulfur subunit [Solirubrobacteraceae bacterium]
MPEYTLRIRRFDPQSGDAAYWDEHTVEMPETQSVLDAILSVRDTTDGSIGIRCSCQQAICGSCGVRMNGKPGLACNTHLEEAAKRKRGTASSATDGAAQTPVITVEPMGNMPVIRDLIVDMDAVHWKKIQRVTPWLINKEPIPEREYIVPHDNMVDVTQTMACIQCGACVSDCLAMEVDPGFIGPAALAKSYRFVGDPRDAQHRERLKDLSEDEQGIYDCTHCFNCIEACPKGVDPMNQIMRLRRIAGSDFKINDRNNGHRHEAAFVTLVRDYGLLHEAELLPRSYGGNSWWGKFHPAAAMELLSSLSSVVTAVMRGKVSPKLAMLGHKIPADDLKAVKQIYTKVDGRDERNELNLYVTGYEDDPRHAPHTDIATPLHVDTPVAQATDGAATASPTQTESETT